MSRTRISRAQFLKERGDRIREQRLALGISQEELAEAAMCSQGAISCWELGKGSIDDWSHFLIRSFFKARQAMTGSGEVAR